MPACIPETLLTRFSRFVEEQTGLYFPSNRLADLERGMTAAAHDFGTGSAESCIRKLMASPLTKEQVETLAGSLTVGETYFFRDPGVFDALEKEVLPNLIQSRRGEGQQRVRIWCAGCCTGEEPYSVAILLSRLLPDIAHWGVTILATDINPAFLRKASEGVYGQWSFRETPEAMKRKYFVEKSAGRFEILPGIRNLVTFGSLNLAEDVYPALANNTNAMDVIFCRNVLMYFSPGKARLAAEKFARSLVEGGWFIAGPSESSADLFAPLVPGNLPGAILYRKLKAGEAPPRPSFMEQPPSPPPRVQEIKAIEAKRAPRPATPAPTPALASQARSAANRGDLAGALVLCDKAISADRLLPANHYLRGVILQEQGAPEEAVVSLKRALYLDPGFVVAHFALGNILRRRACESAARHFENALELLRKKPPHEPLPEAEGITAGRLLEIIQSMKEKK